MRIELPFNQFSTVSLLVSILGSLPAYIIVTMATFLNTELFVSLIGALALSSILDRLVSKIIERKPQSRVELMQRQMIKIISTLIPGFSQTPINPVMRRLSILLTFLVGFSFSTQSIVVAILTILLAVYTEYVELQRPLTTVIFGVLIGSVSGTVFILL